MFNAAQDVLALGAAWAALTLAGIHPGPARPWVPSGGHLAGVALAAAAFFVVNFTLVTTAVSLHARAPLLARARGDLPYQAFVIAALLSVAPLVAVAMGSSVLLVLLFLLPLIAVYLNAAVAVQREQQALHDELTGLPNRKLLLRRTGDTLAATVGSPAVVGFLLLDLDRFKEVNDTFGHPAGDRLLQAVASRLTRSVRPGDLVARLGGDEFAVLLPMIRSAGAAREIAARLRAALAEPLRLDGVTLHIEASVGLATYPGDADNVDSLWQRADMAMYLAKENRTGVEAYDPARDRNSPARLTLLGDLRRALDRSQAELAVQPKIWLADGRPAGLEALIRWRPPDPAMVPSENELTLAPPPGPNAYPTRHMLEQALLAVQPSVPAGCPARGRPRTQSSLVQPLGEAAVRLADKPPYRAAAPGPPHGRETPFGPSPAGT